MDRISCSHSATCRMLILIAGLAVALCDPAAALAQTAPHDKSDQSAGTRILISLQQKRLWLVQRHDTLLTARVAVGRDQTVKLANRTYRFSTPRGTRRVLKKEREPLWTPPDWHYLEKAQTLGLKVVRLQPGARYTLADSTVIEVRGNQVGRINRFGNFWPFTPGTEIAFDRTLFVPPLGTAQRRIPNALGAFKLDLGDGYLIHGTHLYNQDSLGEAASHGCVRMSDEDLVYLYERVRVGTPVHIF